MHQFYNHDFCALQNIITSIRWNLTHRLMMRQHHSPLKTKMYVWMEVTQIIGTCGKGNSMINAILFPK